MPAADSQERQAARQVYGLASRLFAKEVDAPFYRALLTADNDPHTRSSGLGVLVDPVLDDMGEDRALRELSVEFCRLFVGPRPVCPPYASVQRGAAKLGGRAASDLEEFMRRFELEPVVPADVPLLSFDHLSVELALLSHLYDIDAGAAARELLNRHLLPWAPSYLQRVGSAARLAPYSSAALLTTQLLEAELSVRGG